MGLYSFTQSSLPSPATSSQELGIDIVAHCALQYLTTCKRGYVIYEHNSILSGRRRRPTSANSILHLHRQGKAEVKGVHLPEAG